MDYWISSKEEQKGPYSLDQLRLMWQEGQLTADSYYFDSLHSEWRFLRILVENNRQLFTVEEAFVRLGQNRQTGCLTIFNAEQEMQLFAEDGFIINAIGKNEHGEIALAHALRLEGATYEWIYDARPAEPDLRVNIQDYAQKRAIARDARVSNPAAGKTTTLTLPKNILNKVESRQKINYVLVMEETPSVSLRLTKMTSVLGREEHCDLVVDDVQVSRRHCMLEASEQNVRVKDLESSNGTSINGIPITEGFLRVGDVLSLGSYKLILHKDQKRAPEFNG